MDSSKYIMSYFNSGMDSINAEIVNGNYVYQSMKNHYLGVTIGVGLTTRRTDRVKFTSLIQINPSFLIRSNGNEKKQQVEIIRSISSNGSHSCIINWDEKYGEVSKEDYKADFHVITRVLLPLRFEYSPFENVNYFSNINFMLQFTPGIKIQGYQSNSINSDWELRTNLGISYLIG